MSSNLISIWNATFDVGMSSIVIPDGCRDLIVKTVGNEKPDWFVSPLFDQSKLVQIEDNSTYSGFRLSPGAELREGEILSYIKRKKLHADEVKEIIDDFIIIENSVKEALGCLACELGSVKQVSVQLGVSVRTLQRLILNKTKRTPGYWLQLARIRKAAKNLSPAADLIDVAEKYGFSDQSHMNREFQRWFGLTPLQLLNTSSVIRQLNGKGYG
ncbi:MAG TPA: AraC family transcriptional regulator [Pseudoalteromonas prydzensis]|uniref:AraC family transcriptional regulator n=2 Tax=root TaxID=1 RepID=A0A7V1CZY1_9GAMM|nr:helix-turn-helix transcriptional regulator [Pseudoalteromonas prydzensis]HEA17396.1 AraC family transcriptional regulator [Pseudoalteromonas prydzensis]